MIKIKPLQRRWLFGAMGAALLMAHASASAEYPERPITLIAPYSVGGDADMAARTFAAAATRALGQSVVVLNRTGASGVIGSSQVVSAAPDGYTLLLARTGSQAIMPAIMPSATRYRWDDYTFIGTLEINPYGCLVNAKSPYQTFDDLLAAIRTQGETLNYGTAGRITTNSMGPRQLFRLLNLPDARLPTLIPYNGTGEAMTSLLAGQTQFACGSLGAFIPQIRAGTIRVLMVTTPERLATMPDVPTARELKLADMEAITGWSAIFAPPDLPDDIRDKLVLAMQTIAQDPQWRQMTAQTGSIPNVLSPEETRAFVRKQYELYRSLGEMLGMIDMTN